MGVNITYKFGDWVKTADGIGIIIEVREWEQLYFVKYENGVSRLYKESEIIEHI